MTKIESKNSLYPHNHFTEHLMGAFGKSSWKSDLNHKSSSLFNRWLKNYTCNTLQQFTQNQRLETNRKWDEHSNTSPADRRTQQNETNRKIPKWKSDGKQILCAVKNQPQRKISTLELQIWPVEAKTKACCRQNEISEEFRELETKTEMESNLDTGYGQQFDTQAEVWTLFLKSCARERSEARNWFLAAPQENRMAHRCLDREMSFLAAAKTRSKKQLVAHSAPEQSYENRQDWDRRLRMQHEDLGCEMKKPVAPWIARRPRAGNWGGKTNRKNQTAHSKSKVDFSIDYPNRITINSWRSPPTLPYLIRIKI
jgi:hypothetical protein